MPKTLEAIRADWGAVIDDGLGRAVGDAGLLTRMAKYHLQTGGKRLRALIPVQVCVNLGGDAAAAVNLGTGLELLHNATLVHDDVQDGDTVRRGQPTVWMRWGEAQAVNLGDALYFQGMARIARTRVAPRVLTAVCAALTRVVEGQTMEFQLQLAPDHEDAMPATVAYWERMARGKTGALFGACFMAGAVAANVDDEIVAEAQRYGEDLGLLFQVQDDFLDLVGDKGRGMRGADLAEGKMSFPVVWTLTYGTEDDVAALERVVRCPRDETTGAMVAEGLKILEASGALEATAEWLRQARVRANHGPLADASPGLAERFLAPVAHAL